MLWIVLALSTAITISLFPTEIAALIISACIILIVAFISPVAAVITMLVLAPLRVLIATEAEYQLPLDIGQLCLSLVILTIIINQTYRVFRLKTCLYYARYLFVVFPFLAIIILNGFVASSATAWINEFLKWIQIALLLTMTILLSKHAHWIWLVGAVIVAGASNALIGIYQFLGGSGAIHLVINDRHFRAFGTFGQPNPFGGFLGIITPIAIAISASLFIRLYRHRSSIRETLFTLMCMLCSVIMLCGIIMSWSRGAWIALVIALAIMASAIPQNFWKGLWFGSAALLLFISLWISNTLPTSITARLQSSVDEFISVRDVRGVDIDPSNYAVIERLAHWQGALNMARSFPWLGVGFGNYEIVYDDFRLLNWKEPLGHAHNYYLNLLGELGLLGLLVYGKVWLILFTMAWQSRKHPNPISRAVAIGLLGSWTYFSVHSLFDNIYVNNLFLHLGTLIGILVVIYDQTLNKVKVEVSSCLTIHQTTQ
jgi:putative inorganic carbon (hco3(-)) transporter